MRWVQDFRMRPEAPDRHRGDDHRINANTAIQMDVIAEKVEPRLAGGANPVTEYYALCETEMTTIS